MAVEILMNEDGRQVLICNTMDVAFGPVFYEDESAQDFLDWYRLDVRNLLPYELAHHVGTWRTYFKQINEDFLDLIEGNIVDAATDADEDEYTVEDSIITDYNDKQIGLATFKIAVEHEVHRGDRDTPDFHENTLTEVISIEYKDTTKEDGDFTEAQNDYLLGVLNKRLGL